MKKLYFICLIMIVHVEYLTAQEDRLTKTFALPSNNYKVNDTSTIEPLTKPVKVVSIIDQKSETFKRELEVWNAFLGSVDLQNIGFIFLVRPLVDLDRFKKHWFEEMQMNYPFFYDQSNKIFATNSISEVKPGHTMVLDKNNEVIEEGGKVINTDPFNLYRSTLHNLTTEMGIKKAVRGKITEMKDGVLKTFYNSAPIYVTEDGTLIPSKLAKEYIISRRFIMQTSPLSDTVRLMNNNRR